MDEPRQHREEVVNAVIHGVGVVASILGCIELIALTVLFGDAWQMASAIVFGVSLVLLYTASTLYHAVQHQLTKARLKVFDHCAIFLLIAGTYTPFTLVALRGRWGWWLFGTIWSLAVAGIVFKLFCTGRYRRLSTAMYVAMGWLVVVALGPLIEAVPSSTFAWLVAGGLTYTLGTAFYHNRRIPYSHAIWHLFVIGGSFCHFAAVISMMRATQPVPFL